MTRAARASDALAPIERAGSLTLDGRTYAMHRVGEDIWATGPSADLQGKLEPAADAATVERRVVMTTGSHHYEAYWVEGERPGSLRIFPFVYLLGADARWMPRRDAFVEPPEASPAAVRWSSNCIQCHTTGGHPGYEASNGRDESKEPEVAELGIACEACHGPGGLHVEKYRDPVERYRAYGGRRFDASIVDPRRLSPERASMICGTCHAYTYPRDEEEFWDHGYTRTFRPGQDLNASRVVLTARVLDQPGAPILDTAEENLFYDDETVRIGGREYNGMIESACFLRGEGTRKLSCLSCHSMHDSEPDDQLARGREGDAACAGCHDRDRYGSPNHTHHAAGSLGSRCLGCHMPKTAYALLKSIRSHRIDSPAAKSLTTSDRPNACNLCHVDRSLAWTVARLVAWYGQSRAPSAPLDATAAGAKWLLAGDPGQRAVAAAAMGDEGARRAATEDWEAPWLASALLDPYAAVRFIAARSLRRLKGFESVAVDPSAPEAPRRVAVEAAFAIWERAHGRPPERPAIDGLVAARSTRALTLSE
jgi:predicted CXXCH cytochrome family protein